MQSNSNIKLNRDHIASAAHTLFTQKGFEETTIEEIAKTAENSKSTIYVYFSGKTDILKYNVLKSLKGLYQDLSDAVGKNDDSILNYYIICNIILVFAETYPLYYKMIPSLLADAAKDKGNSYIHQDILKTISLIFDKIAEFIENGMKNGTFREDKPISSLGLILLSHIYCLISVTISEYVFLLRLVQADKENFLQTGFDTILSYLL